MRKLKVILGLKIKEKWLVVLTTLGLLGLLAPIIRLGLYAVPFYDDYLHLSFPKSFFMEYGGVLGWFQGVLWAVKSQYYAWQGTYSTQFIVSANPFFWNEEYYAYAVIAVLLLFMAAVMAAVMILLKNLLGMKFADRWFAAVVIALSLIEFICTAQQGIYWYNGAVHYTLMHGLMLLMLAVAVMVCCSKKTWKAIASAFLCALLGIVVAGSNYVTILQGLLLLITIMGLGLLLKKRRSCFLVFPILCYSVGFYLNVSAPGNNVRASYFEGYGAIKSILYSFRSAGEQFWNFTGMLMLLVMLLLLPVFWNAVQKVNYQFRFPGLVTIYSVCLYATGFTSSYYAMGSAGVERTWVVVKFTLQILLFVNEIYWLGWISHRKERRTDNKYSEHYLMYYLLICAVGLIVLMVSPNRDKNFLSLGTYQCIHSGEAYNFYCQYKERVEKLKGDETVVELEPFAWKPYYLFIGDLSEDPKAQNNRGVASWYNKEAIYIKNR